MNFMTDKSLKEYCHHDKLSKTDSFDSTGGNLSLLPTRICYTMYFIYICKFNVSKRQVIIKRHYHNTRPRGGLPGYKIVIVHAQHN